MRILNDESKEKVDNVSIFLTLEEAEQLACDLKLLLNNPKIHHTHLSSEDYQKEITVCIYDANNLEAFHPRAIKLIKEDK